VEGRTRYGTSCFQWVYGRPEEDEDIKAKILSSVPSLHDVERENEENLNPMLAWVREELTPGAYIRRLQA